MPEVKQGWGEWAGSGVNNQKHLERVAKSERIKRVRIEELKKKRADSKMRGVIVNTEDRDKKFAHKYLVKELPHSFKNQEHFKKTMD
jgi:U3 small nucleolar RNA-associated protein 14